MISETLKFLELQKSKVLISIAPHKFKYGKTVIFHRDKVQNFPLDEKTVLDL
jgi:hypothetical protein